MKILKGKQPGPRRMMLYGDNGIGKSTLAARFPRPIMLNLEDGARDVEVDKTEKINDYTGFKGAVSWLLQNEHDYRTVIVDTADWLEGLIFKHVATTANKKSIAAIPYGQGYDEAVAVWMQTLADLEQLWHSQMHIVITAHVKIAKFANPTGDAFNYYAPALHEKTGAKLLDWCDEVLFLTTRVQTIKKDEGFGGSRVIGIGGTERIIYTTDVASHFAKNRLNMPAEIPMTIEAIGGYIRANQATGNVAEVATEAVDSN